MRRLVAIAMIAAGLAAACGSVEKAAAQDPRKCERDPKCNAKQDKSRDCYTACSDDLACVDRCRQVTGQE